MPGSTPIDAFAHCTFEEKAILLLLALNGEPLGKTRLLDYVRKLGLRNEHGDAYNAATLADTMADLRARKLVEDASGTGSAIASAIVSDALLAGFDIGMFEQACQVIEADQPAMRPWAQAPSVRNYRHGVARLRMALLRGEPPAKVYPWFEACALFIHTAQATPFVAACGQPFVPALFARLHPGLQDEVMTHLLFHALDDPASAPPLHAWLAQRETPAEQSVLRGALAEHWIACGRFDDAWALVADSTGGFTQMLRAAILLLRGDRAAALPAFEVGLKALRRESGKRNLIVGGLTGVLHLLALLRSSDASHRKQADTLLSAALRQGGIDPHVLAALLTLHRVQSGVLPPDAARDIQPGTSPLSQLLHALLLYWLGQSPALSATRALADAAAHAEAGGLHWLSTQVAGILGHLGDAQQASHAAARRAQFGMDDLAGWFERQEPWRRQLAALAELQSVAPAAEKKAAGEARLVWLVHIDPRYGFIEVEPREQKRDARGQWTKGRPVALKRLHGDRPAYLTEQDARACAAIRVNGYYDGVRYELDPEKALAALVGHPLVFQRDHPEVRMELLAGAPQLLVTEQGRKVQLQLQPAFDANDRDVLVARETPTRLRIIGITPEHRRIAAIVGDGLAVPAHGKDEVLRALGAVSALITVQSDIGGVSAQAEQVDADKRLHVHLLPYQEGLRMQILVKPFVDGGPYFAPGQGTENLIADIDGKPLQTRRDLDAERANARQLVAACPILADVAQEHGEWLLPDPRDALELLLQLQACREGIVIAWPEGEKFSVGKVHAATDMRLTIKSERDWFAAGGELRVDDDTVLDLRELLERVPQGRGRFIALGDNRFLALTEEFHRRLSELATFGEAQGKGVRVHPLASFALEELADEAGACKADKAWKEHLARLRGLDHFDPPLPGTLRAELRDYQLTGFRWLAQLAEWGVGACLADDMGLGKTVQTLALLLHRAAGGPALVVAPTSVCMNWIAEAARFAPTLKTTLFGAGDRGQTLAGLQAFDLVIVSYGLLQQEAELFASMHWHTVVLDEAQAIKNAATKRSQAVMNLSAAFRIAVTGTPLENHLGELWNLFRFLNPGLLGSLEQFNQRFAQPIERQQDARARAALRRLIQPFILRRTKTGVLAELPPRIEIVREVELSAEESALYEALRRDALERLAQDDAPANQKSLQILAEIMKLRRACCHPQLVAPELGLSGSKLAAFGELLDELLENRHKALVFSQFVDHLALIRAELDRRGVRYQYLDGATPMQERKKRVDAFQSGDGDLFLISLKAGGTGLNLTAADYVIHMDPWWNPAVEDQASDRAHRMGQQRPVTIYRLVARHTIEESIVDLHRHKRDLADSLLEGSDAAGKMSAQEMLRLLQLG